MLQPCSQAASKWRENEEMDRELGNGQIIRKWTENEEVNRERRNGKRMKKLRGNGENVT